MSIKIHTAALWGLQGNQIEIEVDIRNGLFAFNIVGLGSKAVQEAKDRVVAAIHSSGFEFPAKRITINLAPASLAKQGTTYDLPISIAILAATDQIASSNLDGCFWGELALDGALRKCNGAIAVANFVKQHNAPKLYLPVDNAQEASVVDNVQVVPVASLSDCVKAIEEGRPAINWALSTEKLDATSSKYDFKFVKGQFQTKRTLEIAATGGHNVLMVGSPGAGKTFMAKCMHSIMPNLSRSDAVDVTTIHSVAGLNYDGDLITQPPFRNPHHSSSAVSIVGGGSIPHPGEITLAHKGILFLDEMNFFDGRVLEVLRQPLEDKVVNIARASGSAAFPADFTLVAAINPCKCGYLGDDRKVCTCGQLDLANYSQRLSGPILDRIDMQVRVSRQKVEELENSDEEDSEQIKARVVLSRKYRAARLAECKNNDKLDTSDVKWHLNQLTQQAKQCINDTANSLHMSTRAYLKTISVARTIADMQQSDMVEQPHVIEALSLRLSVAN